MSTELHQGAVCYGCYDGENIIGFIGILHFPHPRNKKIKTVSRLCVLPDYQGIGIGRKFLNEIAKIYVGEGYDFKITTSAKNLIAALRKDKNWVMGRYGVSKPTTTKNKNCEKMTNTGRFNCKTASFYFKNG